ncbi:MAG: hypothetical protein HOP11_14380 [Saprospiraceae bacterium]|nr:hypothetical protein [Saprospiraceae bacterium]
MPRYIPYKHNITKAKRGDYFEESFDFGVFSLSGKSAKAQVRDESGGTILLSFSTTDSTININANVLKLICTADKFTLSPGVYVYDIQLYTSITDVATMIEGTIEITDQITE